MRATTFAALLLFPASLFAGIPKAGDSVALTLANGTKVIGTLTRINASQIAIMDDSGITTIQLAELCLSDQQKFEFDPEQSRAIGVKQQKQEAIGQTTVAKRLALTAFDALIDAQYDKFKNVTKFSSKSDIVTSAGINVGYFCVTGPELPLPDRFALHLLSKSDDWRFLDYSDFIIVSDKVKKDFGKLEHHRTVGSGYVLEQFFPIFTVEEFKQIAFAASVEARLGIAEFSLPYADREGMRALISHFDFEPIKAKP